MVDEAAQDVALPRMWCWSQVQELVGYRRRAPRLGSWADDLDPSAALEAGPVDWARSEEEQDAARAWDGHTGVNAEIAATDQAGYGPVHSQLLIDWREQHPDAAEDESYIPHTGDVEKGSDAFAER